jgi:hypothetical protein
MNKNYLNTDQYSSYVVHTPPGMEEHGWANVRGYGTVTLGSVQNNNITKNSYVWNRLQPLDKPYGTYPPNCKNDNCQPSSETTLAWGCQKPKNYNDSVFRLGK